MSGPFGPPEPDVDPAPLDPDFLSRVRTDCIRATASVNTALSVPRGPQRSEQVSWAKQRVLEALGGLVDDRFWEQLHADVDLPPRDFVLGDQLTRVQDLFSDNLTQVLLEVGYQPPPPAWILVNDARGAVEHALLFGAAPDYRSLQAHLQSLIDALRNLEVGAEPPGYLRQLLQSCGRILIGGAVAAGAALGTGAMDAIGEEYVFTSAISVIDHVLEKWSDEPEVPAGYESSEGDDRDADVDTEKARRRAESEAELVELNLEIARERLRATRAQAARAEIELAQARRGVERPNPRVRPKPPRKPPAAAAEGERDVQ